MASEQTEVKTIALAGPITLYEVSAVRDTLRRALADGKPLRIDLTDSGPWDIAGLQLLVSCVKTGRDQGQPIHLVGTPGVFSEIAERSGLSEWVRSVEE